MNWICHVHYNISAKEQERQNIQKHKTHRNQFRTSYSNQRPQSQPHQRQKPQPQTDEQPGSWMNNTFPNLITRNVTNVQCMRRGNWNYIFYQKVKFKKFYFNKTESLFVCAGMCVVCMYVGVKCLNKTNSTEKTLEENTQTIRKLFKLNYDLGHIWQKESISLVAFVRCDSIQSHFLLYNWDEKSKPA